MKKIQYSIVIALLLISSVAMAQQENIYTYYRQHMNLVNPAYAGMNNLTLVTSTLRKQWTGVVGAPETQAVSFGTPLGGNLGIGVSFISGKTFIEEQTFLGIDFSYKLAVISGSDIYFGIKAGGNFYNVNALGLETYNISMDPALGSINTFNPNIGVGAVYKKGAMYISLSIPRLLNTKRATNEAGYASVATDSPHIYFSGGYDFDLSPSLVLKPSTMLRYVNGAPVSLDLITMVQIDKIVEVGAMYRTDKAYAAMASVLISNRLLFGFAYEMSTQPSLASAKNTNEILLQFKF
jgi:type IX secretion system PorP/SprF family membrane protein